MRVHIPRCIISHALLGVPLLVALACREEPALFTPADRPGGAALARQLTFSTGDELSPTWQPGGSAVIYSGDFLPPFPHGRSAHGPTCPYAFMEA